MEYPEVHYAGLLLKLLVWVWLIHLSHTHNLKRHYPLVFRYVATTCLFTLALTVIASFSGVSNAQYASVYVVGQFAILLLTALILLKIYWIFDKFSWGTDWHLLVVPVVLIQIELLQNREAWFFFRLIYCLYAVVLYIGLAALVRRILSRKVVLGWNLSTVLLSFTIPGIFNAISFATFLHEGNAFFTQVWNQLTSILSLFIIAVGMTEYSPPRLVEEVELAEQLEFRVVRVRMWESIKLLWRLLRS